MGEHGRQHGKYKERKMETTILENQIESKSKLVVYKVYEIDTRTHAYIYTYILREWRRKWKTSSY